MAVRHMQVNGSETQRWQLQKSSIMEKRCRDTIRDQEQGRRITSGRERERETCVDVREGNSCGEEGSRASGAKGAGCRGRGVWSEAQVCVTRKRRKLAQKLRGATRRRAGSSSGASVCVFDIGLERRRKCPLALHVDLTCTLIIKRYPQGAQVKVRKEMCRNCNLFFLKQ